jgi:hypothetical protein
MATKYYGYLYEMEDTFRNKKYYSLLLASLQNDISKWSEFLASDKTKYQSPKYNNSVFIIEVRSSSIFAYVYHNGTPPIFGRQAELISDNFPSELSTMINKLRESIYTPEIYEIEKIVGPTNNRKEKLQFLDIEQIKLLVEETYQDWLKEETVINAKFIAKILYSYRRKEEIYKLWLDKFAGIELIDNELKKLK